MTSTEIIPLKPKILDRIVTGMPGKGSVKQLIHLIAPDNGGIECVHFQDGDGVFGAEAVEDLVLHRKEDEELGRDAIWRVRDEVYSSVGGGEDPKWLLDGLAKYHQRK